jgi:hypothetical protein
VANATANPAVTIEAAAIVTPLFLNTGRSSPIANTSAPIAVARINAKHGRRERVADDRARDGTTLPASGAATPKPSVVLCNLH